MNWESQDQISDEELLSAARFSENEFVSLEELEQEYINHVLKCCRGKKTKAAQVLGIDKTTLWRNLRRYENESETV
jgi:DNA-binding NtrC family response regulator